MNGPAPIRKPYFIHAAIVFAAAVGLLLMVQLAAVNWSWQKTISSYDPLIHQVHQITEELSTGRLLYGEARSDPDPKHADTASQILAQATTSIDGVLAVVAMPSISRIRSPQYQSAVDNLSRLKQKVVQTRALLSMGSPTDDAAVQGSIIRLMDDMAHESVFCGEQVHALLYSELGQQSHYIAWATIIWLGVSLAGFITLLRISRRHLRSERILRESERKFRQLYEDAPLAYQLLDERGILREANPAWLEMLGYSQEEVIGRWFGEFVADEGGETFRRHFDRFKAEGRISNVVATLVRKDGSRVTISAEGRITCDDRGRFLHTHWILIDITARLQSERALKESEERFRAVFDSAPDLVFIKDRQLRYVHINPTMERLVGLPVEQLLGKTSSGLFGVELGEKLDAAEQRVLSGETIRKEMVVPLRSMSYTLDVIIVPMRDEAGSVVGLCGIARDVTERQQAAEALRESLQTSADIVASIPSGLQIYSFEPPDRFSLITGNPEAEELSGLRIGHHIGGDLCRIWTQAREAGLFDEFIRVMNTGQTFATDNFPYQDARINCVFRIRAFRMPGSRLGMAFENITERTRAYEILRESEARYRFVYKHTPVIMHSTDPDGRIISVSNYWIEAMGYDRHEVIGRNAIDFLTPESRRLAREQVLPEFLRTGSCTNIPFQMVKKNGDVIDVLLSAVAERDVAGQTIRSLAVMIDVTELKRSESKTGPSSAPSSHELFPSSSPTLTT